MIFGEITTGAEINYEEVVRNAVRDIGYDSVDKGINFEDFEFVNRIEA